MLLEVDRVMYSCSLVPASAIKDKIAFYLFVLLHRVVSNLGLP